jgi:WD40 repeat protein
MKIWNVETETCLQTLKGANTGCIFSIIILSNERIISANEDGKIVIWDNGEILKIIDAHSSGIWGLVKLSKNKIISGSNDKTIKVWDIESGDCLNIIEAHTSYIFCLDAF